MSSPSPTDVAWGAFSDAPPWVLVDEHPSWREGVDELRALVEKDVPTLTRARRWPPGLRVARVALRIVTAVGPWAARKKTGRYPSPELSRGDLSRRLRRAAEDLGPTYIKLGQIISGGQGLFPEELVSQFKLLRDQVPEEPFDVVRAVVEHDLGRSIETVFEWFDRVPIAAASKSAGLT